jgi:hydrogenase maturation protein HypF
MSVGSQVFVSQHIGDLETEGAYSAFRRVIADFEKLYDLKPDVFATDLHPDYLSTKFARSELDGRHIPVQHHIAHVLSCMAENEIDPPALGVAWDGTGYGLDGTSWGGEFFLINDSTADRIAHLRPFRLPGGDAAVKQPRRAALGLLYEIYGDDIFQRTDLAPVASFSTSELAALKTMLARGLNSPPNTSVGRLFDAVASLLNLRQQVGFEGQAAMDLEFALEGIETNERYALSISAPATVSPKLHALPSSLATHHSPLTLDWAPMIEAILTERQRGVSVGEISVKFHNTLAEAIVQVARLTGEEREALSGGCFQNRYLTERSVQRLREEGFRPYWHQRVPPNDGGIALGQIVGARRELANREASSRLLQHSNRDQAQFACRSPSRPLESGERGNHLTSVQHLAS